MPHQAKGAINRIVGQTLISKTLPRFTEAEVRTEALETNRVVCPAFLREKVNKISPPLNSSDAAEPLNEPVTPLLGGEWHSGSQQTV